MFCCYGVRSPSYAKDGPWGLLLMILHYLKDPNYGNYGIVLTMGYCRIYIINRAPKIALTALVLEPLA